LETAVATDTPFTPPTRQQLLKLGIVSSLPFVGFGFMDNVIMIIAGDAIDASIGVKLGVSTMCAAGLGNTLSDCVGLFAGDWIESLCKRAGIKEPKLTDEQAECWSARCAKTGSSVVGLAFGCLLGMFPLAFQYDRKPLYFKEDQMEIYEALFQPHGVTLHEYFDLMAVAEWVTAEKGTVLAEAGKPMHSVFMLHTGSAVSTQKDGTEVYVFRGKCLHPTPASGSENDGKSPAPCDATCVAAGLTLRGSVIGGTALMDEKLKVSELPYPYSVTAAETTRYIRWDLRKLRELMSEDKAVESAVYSLLYADLLEHTRRNRKHQQPKVLNAPYVDEGHAKDISDYKMIVEMAIADGFVHQAERALCRAFRTRKCISEEEHYGILMEFDWTDDDWSVGSKDHGEHGPTRSLDDLRQRIFGLLRGMDARINVVHDDI